MHLRSRIKNRKKNIYCHRNNRYFLNHAKQEVEEQKIAAASWRFFSDRKVPQIAKISSITIHTEFFPEYFCVSNWKFETTSQRLLFFLLLSQMIIPTVSYVNHHTEIHDLPVENFTHREFSCIKKVDGISRGKICEKNGIIYFMKNIDVTENTQGLLEVFNREFVKNNIGAKTPNSNIFYDELTKQYHIASKKIDDFRPAKDFYAALQTHQDNPHANLARRDVAKLAVAMTFIDDLHDENWGVDKNGIVIVDVDSVGQNFQNLDNYHVLASLLKFNLNASGFYDISLSNILQMLDIYKDMLEKPLPRSHDICQLSHDEYRTLLKLYIKACEEAITKIKLKFPHLGLHDSSVSVLRELNVAFNRLADETLKKIPSRKIAVSRLCP
ncbi:MAG: hypothetical protein ACYCQI_00140 [Gammaproteobacteria bacterium]